MAPKVGFRHTSESKAKMSSSLKGHPVSELQREKISQTLMGHPVSEESRKRMSKPHKTDDEIGYSGIHHRLRKLFQGKSCYVCGSKDQIQVALKHQAENVRIGANGFRFSVNLDDYFPLCVTHHRQYDLGIDKHGILEI